MQKEFRGDLTSVVKYFSLTTAQLGEKAFRSVFAATSIFARKYRQHVKYWR